MTPLASGVDPVRMGNAQMNSWQKNSWAVRSLIAAFFVFMPLLAMAQQPPAATPEADQPLLTRGELDALVAPIALYPDPLLAGVLMASTYPLEVVQAERWANDDKNKKLTKDQLKSAVDKQPWDQSVKSLVATPSVLTMMSQKLDWTQKLGDAVLAQQSDAMDAVQRLRAKAQANNKLTTTKEQTVTVKQGDNNKQAIVIEPASPDTVYVPYYEPSVVYGDWPYPDYPPYYFPAAPGYIASGVIASGIAFGAGYALGRWRSGGNYWGGGVNWNRNDINVNRPVNINNVGNSWQHNPQHRQGVRYNNANVQQKFGNNDNARTGNRTPGSGTAAGNRNQSGSGQGSGERSPSGANRSQKSASGKGAKSAGKGAKNAGKSAKSAGKSAKSAGKGAKSAGKGAKSTGKGAKSTNVPRGGSQAGGANRSGGGGARASGGRGGGGGGGRGGGRRSDIGLKHDIVLLGHLDNGLGIYRFSYNGSDKAYVGVLAQEAQALMRSAVVRGRDGYLRVFYDKLGLRFQTYEHWLTSGAQIPSISRVLH
jgi:Protein of unknown function (DUF3300)